MKAKMTDGEAKIEIEVVEKAPSVEGLSDTDSYDQGVDGDGDGDIEGEIGGDGEVTAAKPIDDDLDRRNPQYIPKAGAFYEHDNRTLDVEEVEEPTDADKKKKVWKESKSEERWLHDCYVEEEQESKSTDEIIATYGYDIRNEENAPRARRRRKYGRGPDKYDRKWDDEQAYNSSPRGGRGRGRRIGPQREDFPPLMPQNGPSGEKEPVVREGGRGKPNTAWRSQPPGEPRNEPRQAQPHHQQQPPIRGSPPGKPANQQAPPAHKTSPAANYETAHRPQQPRPRMEDNIKPFRNDGATPRAQEVPKGRPNEGRPSSGHMQPNRAVQDLSQSMASMSVNQKPKPRDVRSKEVVQEVSPRSQPMDNTVTKQNPKRYSKIRKGFTGYFPPEDCPDLDPREAKAALEMAAPTLQRTMAHIPQAPRQQDIIVQSVNVLPRYADTYNGNAAYMPARPILQPMPQPGLTAPPPMTQALSPQMTGMEMQPQPSFVSPPLYIDMGQGEVMPFPGYTAYPQGQSTELYQASSGITYYRPEIQAGQQQGRPVLPQRRKAAIPIVPPP